MLLRTRFAPSPTGDLHLGSAWTALASWVLARRDGGEHVLRVEDLDPPRVVAGAEARIEDDLRWLGLDWDGGPIRQSERATVYEEAIASLAAKGLVYACDCSRAEIARSASAPHAGEETVYPGLCRERDPARAMKRPPALRVRVPDEVVRYDDGALGPVAQNLAREVGDFVLQRGDGVFAYQLAVVVDDVATRITDVVRGADLVSSTPRQIWLARALGGAPPRYAHVPLVVAGDGSRLEKRTRAATVRELRERGVPAERIVGALAHGLGLAPTAAETTALEVARACRGRPVVWRRDPWPIPASLAGG
ncbi:MAG TPA: tRNA glutamyl-Q(34) synthetase GluQRS [Polyangiaceae bacterium]